MKITRNYLEISQLYAAVCHGQRERGGSNLACSCNIPVFCRPDMDVSNNDPQYIEHKTR